MSPKDSQTHWRRLVPGFLTSVLVLGAVLLLGDPGDVARSLLNADYRVLSAGALLMLLWLWVRALAWREILGGRPRVCDVFFALNQGYLLNNLLPFRLGEVGRAYLLSRKTGIDFWQVVSSILVERAIDLLLAVGLVLGTLSMVAGAEWARPAAMGTGAAVLCGLTLLFLVARNPHRVVLQLAAFGARWPRFHRLVVGRLPTFLAGLAAVTDGRRFIRVLSLLLLNWGLGVVQYVLVLRAFIADAPPLWGAFALGLAALGVAVPSGPGSVGVFEGSVVLALAAFGVDEAESLAFAISVHVLQVVITALFGAFALVRSGETLLGIYKEVRGVRAKDSV